MKQIKKMQELDFSSKFSTTWGNKFRIGQRLKFVSKLMIQSFSNNIFLDETINNL